MAVAPADSLIDQQATDALLPVRFLDENTFDITHRRTGTSIRVIPQGQLEIAARLADSIEREQCPVFGRPQDRDHFTFVLFTYAIRPKFCPERNACLKIAFLGFPDHVVELANTRAADSSRMLR